MVFFSHSVFNNLVVIVLLSTFNALASGDDYVKCWKVKMKI